jgi:hypothetical protein
MQRMHARNFYIGTTVERTALAALLPTDGIGAMFYDTDEDITYMWTGVLWKSFGGELAFIELIDVPTAYTGDGGKLVRVKIAEDGLEFVSPSAGDGDVIGPAGAVNNNLPLFDGVTGKLLKDSGISLDSTDRTNLDNLSGTNSGDQFGDGTTITGSGTGADPFVAVAGSGDVTGPVASVTGNVVTFLDDTGKVISDSGHLLSEYVAIISKSGTEVSVANTTTETTVHTGPTIIGNSIGVHGSLRMKIIFNLSHQVSCTTTIRVKLGGTTVATMAYPQGVTDVTKPSVAEIIIANLGVANVQRYSYVIAYNDGTGKLRTGNGAGAANTANDLELTVTIQHSVANAGNIYLQYYILVEQLS